MFHPLIIAKYLITQRKIITQSCAEKGRRGQFLCLIALLVIGYPGGSQAQDTQSAPASTWTGTVALSTKYLSRGLDVSEGPPVPQAGFEYADLSGVYVDGYAAKIRYFGMNAEVDGNIGYRGKWGKLNYDLGIYYYYYPGAGPALHSNFGELGAKLTWGEGRVIPVLETYVSNNYFFGAGKSVFVWSGVDFSLPASVAVSARIGYVAVEDNRAFSYPDYSTWLLSAGKEFFGLTWSLQLTDTSMTRRDCTDGSRCSVKFTVKIAKTF